VDFLKRNSVLLFLLLVVLAEGGLAWRQEKELGKLRAAELAHAERAAQLDAAGKRAEALQVRIAASHRGPAAEMLGAGPAATNLGSPRLSFDAAFRLALENPKFRRALSAAEKGSLDRFYGPLFRGLALPPEKLEQLKNLMVEAQLAKTDALYAAADQGLAPGTGAAEHYEATAAAQKESYDQIHTLLGDAGFEQYQEYQQERFLHLAMASVQQSLSFTAAPLTDDQANQVAKVLFQSIPADQRPDATGYMAQVGAGVTDTTALYLRSGFSAEGLTAAQSLLSAPQMQVLVQLQQAQAAQRQIGNLWRAAHPSATP
jgi:hypothetical protein